MAELLRKAINRKDSLEAALSPDEDELLRIKRREFAENMAQTGGTRTATILTKRKATGRRTPNPAMRSSKASGKERVRARLTNVYQDR